MTNRGQSRGVSSARAWRRYYRKSNLLDGRHYLWPHFPRAYQRRPTPWGGGLQSLALFYIAQRHRPWRNYARDPCECVPMDKETFRGQRILVCHSCYRHGTHRPRPIAFANAVQPRRHYIFACRFQTCLISLFCVHIRLYSISRDVQYCVCRNKNPDAKAGIISLVTCVQIS